MLLSKIREDILYPETLKSFNSAHSFRRKTSPSQCKYVIFVLSVSLFSLLFILKGSLLVLQCMTEKEKHTTGKEKKKISSFNSLFSIILLIVS